MASPNPAPASRRPTDLQRSAFWIYGVTAMVMREPFGLVIRHTTDAGLRDSQVRLELLRVLVILVLLARLFLISGLYFETVYMRPDSTPSFPRRSYPIDFLAGLAQFLVGAAATTAIGTHSRVAEALAPFSIAIVVFLLVDTVWFGIALARRFSSSGLIKRQAAGNLMLILAAAAVWGGSLLAGADAVFADQAALLVIAAGATLGIAGQIRTYEALEC